MKSIHNERSFFPSSDEIRAKSVASFVERLKIYLAEDAKQGYLFSTVSLFSLIEKEEPNFYIRLVSFLRKNANSNDPFLLYLNGVSFNVEQNIDLEKSFSFFHKSAKLHFVRSIYNLAICYHKGEGVSQNQREAIKLYKAAVNANHPEAIFNLAICYENGEGVEKNQIEAIRLYKLGKRMDHPNSIFNLGVCYEKGEGVEKNYQEAANLYSIASAFHDLRATVKLFIFYLLS
jgi:hypothetical protein